MPPVRPDNPDSRPAGAPGGDPRQESAPARAAEERPAPPTTAPPTTTPPANALFRTLLKGAGDAETAYTAAQEIQSMAGQNVTTELVARMDVLQGRTNKAITELGARFEAALKSAVTEVRTDLKAAVTELRTDLNSAVTELRTDLNSAVREVRSDLKTAVREVRTDLKAEIAVRADSLEKQIRLTWAFLTLQAVTLTAVLVRLFAA